MLGLLAFASIFAGPVSRFPWYVLTAIGHCRGGLKACGQDRNNPKKFVMTTAHERPRIIGNKTAPTSGAFMVGTEEIGAALSVGIESGPDLATVPGLNNINTLR